MLTVSEESLKGTGLHGKNYEYIMSSPEYVEVLFKNYKDEYGVPIKVIFNFYFKDVEISQYFHEQVEKHGETHKTYFVSLKKAFEIQEKKTVEVREHKKVEVVETVVTKVEVEVVSEEAAKTE